MTMTSPTRRRVVLALPALLLLGGALPCRARQGCACKAMPSADEARRQVEYVVVARVVRVQSLHAAFDDTVAVAPGAPRAWTTRLVREYLVYGVRHGPGLGLHVRLDDAPIDAPDIPGDSLVTASACERTRPLADAADDLRRLGRPAWTRR